MRWGGWGWEVGLRGGPWLALNTKCMVTFCSRRWLHPAQCPEPGPACARWSGPGQWPVSWAWGRAVSWGCGFLWDPYIDLVAWWWGCEGFAPTNEGDIQWDM